MCQLRLPRVHQSVTVAAGEHQPLQYTPGVQLLRGRPQCRPLLRGDAATRTPSLPNLLQNLQDFSLHCMACPLPGCGGSVMIAIGVC